MFVYILCTHSYEEVIVKSNQIQGFYIPTCPSRLLQQLENSMKENAWQMKMKYNFIL